MVFLQTLPLEIVPANGGVGQGVVLACVGMGAGHAMPQGKDEARRG